MTLSVIVGNALACPQRGIAYKLSPVGTAIETHIAAQYSGVFKKGVAWGVRRGMVLFSEAVHEEITQRIYGCQGDVVMCGNADIAFADPYVLAGVRWNDDPPFKLGSGQGKGTVCKISETIRFTTQPQCWYQLYADAETTAAKGDALGSLMARSHFGDLQFLHAMASRDGELAGDTQSRIMMWAEFTWKVSRGDYALDTRLKDVKIAGLYDLFGDTDWRVQELFALGNPVLRQRIKDVAFGSLLHMVEDSFAQGHTARAGFGGACPTVAEHEAAGRIREFHSYVNQDHQEHATRDSRAAFVQHWETDRPTVVDVGQVLLEYYRRVQVPSWDEIKPYVECVFLLENPEAPATAGEGLDRRK